MTVKLREQLEDVVRKREIQYLPKNYPDLIIVFEDIDTTTKFEGNKFTINKNILDWSPKMAIKVVDTDVMKQFGRIK